MRQNNIMLTLRSGGDFSFRDVEILSHHLRKQWCSAEELQIFCLYDKIDSVTQLKNCTLIPPSNKEWKGWWSKMNLFAPELEQYRPFLYMDLDTAIVGDYSELFEAGNQEFITLADFYQTSKLASGLMWIPAGNIQIATLWKEWLKDPNGHIKKFRGDQDFIRNFTMTNNFWQNVTDKVCSFKVRESDRSWLVSIPEHISVVCFHGIPRIREAANRVDWIKKYIQV